MQTVCLLLICTHDGNGDHERKLYSGNEMMPNQAFRTSRVDFISSGSDYYIALGKRSKIRTETENTTTTYLYLHRFLLFSFEEESVRGVGDARKSLVVEPTDIACRERPDEF